MNPKIDGASQSSGAHGPDDALGTAGDLKIDADLGAEDSVQEQSDTGFEWDRDQSMILDAAFNGESLVVTGGPGSGKSALSIEIAGRAVLSGRFAADEVVVLTSSRRSAARSRDALMRRIGRTVQGTVVRSTASLAFAIIAAHCRLMGIADPVLATGPEQDADLAQLLLGHAHGDGAPITWPADITAETMQLQGFRAQLRDLLMRCAERGITPEDLAVLGAEHARPHWVAAAQIYDEYLSVTELSRSTSDRGPRYDAATIVDQAARIAHRWVTDDQPERLRWRLVVVDEYQDATAASARLIDALRRDGAQVVLFADPDQAVQGFRGSRPDLAGRAELAPGDSDASLGQFGASVKVLRRSYRLTDEIRMVAARISGQIGAAAGVQHRLRAIAPDDELVATEVSDAGTLSAEGAGGELAGDQVAAGDGIVVDLEARPSQIERRHTRSRAEETAWIAWQIRHAHYFDGVPWSQCAVLTRTGAHVQEIVRGLQRAGVPAVAQGSDVPLRAEPVVRLLLETITRARNDSIDDVFVHELLVSAYGDLDAIGVRALRRAVATLPARDLVASLTGEGGLDQLHTSRVAGTPIAAAAYRIAAMIGAARATRPADEDPDQVCWRVWAAADCAGRWRDQSQHVGPRAVVANTNLDAMMTLFKHAETFTSRHQGATIEQLIAEINRLDIPADSLAATSTNDDVVEVLTAAQATGRQWSYVIVAGVQAGAWPDLRLRDTLLGAQQLADLVDGRGDGTDIAAARKAVLDDELRLFFVACSRTTGRLAITCVDGDDEQPSPLCDLIAPAPDGPVAIVPPPLDLHGIVLRARIAGHTTAEPAWAELLAFLTQQGITVADPDAWYGVAPPSSSAPLADKDHPISVSPSRLALVHQCALRWAAETSDARGGDQFSNELGTLIHDIAREHPTAGPDELLDILHARWPELDLPDGWPTLQRSHEAESMVRVLGEFQRDNPAPVAVEAPFAIETDSVVIRGSIDRIDRSSLGLIVRDLKTGRTVLSAHDTSVDPQLASYQLAVEKKALTASDVLDGQEESIGAELLYVGTEQQSLVRRSQPPVKQWANPQWIEHMAEQAAQIMSSGQLWAKVNPGCRTCPVLESCPVKTEGQPLVPHRLSDDNVPTAPLSEFGTAQQRDEIAFGTPDSQQQRTPADPEREDSTDA